MLIFKTTTQKKILTRHNLITFSIVFTNRNRGGTLNPPPPPFLLKFFLNHNKTFRWHLGDYEKHNFFSLSRSASLEVIRKFFLKHNKSFRWHLGDYEKHIFFPFEGL